MMKTFTAICRRHKHNPRSNCVPTNNNAHPIRSMLSSSDFGSPTAVSASASSAHRIWIRMVIWPYSPRPICCCLSVGIGRTDDEDAIVQYLCDRGNDNRQSATEQREGLHHTRSNTYVKKEGSNQKMDHRKLSYF